MTPAKSLIPPETHLRASPLRLHNKTTSSRGTADAVPQPAVLVALLLTHFSH